MKTCKIDECGKGGRIVRGWCFAHYQRWLRLGDPLSGGSRRYATPEESFAARTEWRGDCLIWTGGKVGSGYGVIYKKGRPRLAHRYSWERAKGPTPKGKHIDHVCHTPACVNVGHLRLATNSENGRNRSGAPSSNRSTGVRNVQPNGSGYMVRVHGQYFGTYRTVEEAAEVAEQKREELFKEYAGKG